MYLEYRRRKWAAGVIAISWIMHIKMAKVRHQLKQARLDNLESFRKRAKVGIYIYVCFPSLANCLRPEFLAWLFLKKT